ncbi:MAG: glycosyltransferase family 2 protein [Prevotella sp.]|nr:glycosyltransferase family 2 protein [Prevotella sp.]
MTEPVVTILVAVYNTATYLRPCLDSLLRQTLHDIQIICIDDASTDGSLTILREYEAADERVEIIALPTNHGQAFARNQGLKTARGQYICFLDSDDWMADDCLEKAVKTFVSHPDTGCVLFHTLYFYAPDRQEEYPMQPFERLTGHDAFVLSLTWKIHGVYMVRADIHRHYPYDESAHAFSDDNTTRLHYLASTEVRYCDGIYYYRQHAASVSHRVDVRRFDYLIANRSMKEKLHEIGASRDIISLYENHRWLNIIDLYMLFFHHRNSMSSSDAALALHLLREAWASIDVSLLTARNRFKFGYTPLQRSWFFFRLQEEIYFSLRKMAGR